MGILTDKILSGSTGSGETGTPGGNPALLKGPWDADTNTPFLASGVGTQGDMYIVSVAGTTDLDGITDWQISDFALFDGTKWNKIDNTEPVFDSSYGEVFFQANATETVIAVQSTPVLTDATAFTPGLLKDFTQVLGRLTYTGTQDKVFLVSNVQVGSLNLATGNVSALAGKNGTVIAKSEQSRDLDGASPSFKPFTAQCLITLSTNDYIEPFNQNNTGTENMTVSDMNLTVKEVGLSSLNPSDVSSGVPVLVVATTSNILGGIGGVTLNKAFYQRIGRIVTINMLATFTTSGTSPLFSVTVPFTPTFTNTNQGTGTSEITFVSTSTLTDGTYAFAVHANPATDAVQFDMFAASASSSYQIFSVFTYEIQ